MKPRFYIGTAGWSIPTKSAGRCSGDGTHLQRYARIFRCAEINTTFHRPHEEATHSRWARSTGPSFRFAVKMPRLITHELRLQGAAAALDRFLAETSALKSKRGPLLVQLPPSLEFDARVAARFFTLLRRRTSGFVVCEPRHATWFSPEAETLLLRFDVGRVAADPTTIPGGSAWRLARHRLLPIARLAAQVLVGLRRRLSGRDCRGPSERTRIERRVVHLR